MSDFFVPIGIACVLLCASRLVDSITCLVVAIKLDYFGAVVVLADSGENYVEDITYPNEQH